MARVEVFCKTVDLSRTPLSAIWMHLHVERLDDSGRRWPTATWRWRERTGWERM